MTMTTSNPGKEEGITLFGSTPGEILAAFHKTGLADRGYAISGRIVPHQAALIGDNGESINLFDGERLYSGTFIRLAD